MSTTTSDAVNVAAHLPRVAREQPDALAVAIAGPRGYTELSCAELDARADRAAHALHGAGIQRGTRTILMVKPSVEFFAITFALFKIGAIPVMVDPGMGIRSLGKCLADAEPEAFVGIPKAHLARMLFGWAKRTLKTRICVGGSLGGRSFARLLAAQAPRTFAIHEPRSTETAAILFTSGSTGTPKGVVYTHETFNAQVQILQQVYGIEPGERDLATFPLFALFGPALGMASVVPRMDASRPATADARDLVASIRDYACTNVFASPALVDLLGRHCAATGTELPTIRRVLSAGAPASPTALERLVAHLPNDSEIFTPYGATEALPVSSIGTAAILGETRAATDRGAGVCVGMPVPGVEVTIIPIEDAPIESWSDRLALPPNEIGEIVVRGPVVTRSYFHRPEADRLAKIRDGAAIRHRMGDVGYLDEAGRLWMCGRKSHRVETDSSTMFTIPCEAVFNTDPAVRRTALVGVRQGGTMQPVLCVELEPGQHGSSRLTERLLLLARSHDHTRRIETVLYHDRFPVDVRHNAKIFREKLAEWATRKLGAKRKNP